MTIPSDFRFPSSSSVHRRQSEFKHYLSLPALNSGAFLGRPAGANRVTAGRLFSRRRRTSWLESERGARKEGRGRENEEKVEQSQTASQVAVATNRPPKLNVGRQDE